MAEQLIGKIELTPEQLDNGILPFPNNHVLVEITHNNDNAKTNAGIIVGLGDRSVHAAGDNSLKADMQECWGTVVKVPEKLYFDEYDNKSMNWETDMELQVGDTVWGSIMEFNAGEEIRCGSRRFKLIPYADLYVAKRGKEVIPLNGYILAQTVNRRTLSDLDIFSEDTIDQTRCVVKFVGKANKRYKHLSYFDHQSLEVDDIVLLAPRTPFLYLERKKYFAKFDGDNLYIVVPRYKIVAVIG